MVLFPKSMKVNTSPYCVVLLAMRLVQASPVTNLVPAIEEELVGVNAVRDGATNERHPMEDQRRLCWVSEEQLLEDVQQHSENAK